MQIKNVTNEELDRALERINYIYRGNVQYVAMPKSLNPKRTRFSLRLRVRDCNGNGARHGTLRRNDGERRRSSNACWHVHGHYFEALLAVQYEAVIRSGYDAKSGRARVIDKNGGNWQELNVGSHFEPIKFSDLCACEGRQTCFRKWTIGEIKSVNDETGGYFWSKDTMRFFKERLHDWGVRHIDGKVYIRNKKSGMVREFEPHTGSIGCPMDRVEVMGLRL